MKSSFSEFPSSSYHRSTAESAFTNLIVTNYNVYLSGVFFHFEFHTVFFVAFSYLVTIIIISIRIIFHFFCHIVYFQRVSIFPHSNILLLQFSIQKLSNVIIKSFNISVSQSFYWWAAFIMYSARVSLSSERCFDAFFIFIDTKKERFCLLRLISFFLLLLLPSYVLFSQCPRRFIFNGNIYVTGRLMKLYETLL